jgi:eukaryotic-like serine/threonine-protein kinase
VEATDRNAEYTAPERAGAGPNVPSVRTDIYSLGAILFELASGKPASSGAPLPDVLDDICLKAMARDPSKRYRSARKMHDAIEAFMSGDRDEDLRRALAAERLVRAAKKVKLAENSESDDGIERVEALRDIGRALALAPDRTPALSLLSKLLDMPPKKLPRDVREEITQQIWKMSANTMYAAVATYIVLFLFVFPIYSFIVGVRKPAHVIAVVVAWALAAFVLYAEHAFTKRPVKTPIAAVMSLLAVGVTSVIMGSNLIVPGLAIIVSMVCILAVQPEWRRLTFGVAVLVVLVPSILNWIGMTDVYEIPGSGRTEHITFIIRGADYHPPWVFHVFLPLLNVLAVLFAGLFASKYRDMLDHLEADNRAKVLGLQRLL